MKRCKKILVKKVKKPYYGSQEYWKQASEYQFKTVIGKKPSGTLAVFALSPRGAKLKASNWEKWLVREKRGTDKVIKSTIKLIKYNKR